jgi:hypothetical protein
MRQIGTPDLIGAGWRTGRGSLIIAAPSITGLIVAFDTTLFIVASVVVALAGVIVLIATKGKLGFKDNLESVDN